ncbi:putative rRNA maturation factor [Peptoniphilus olsenii]|uniref:Endoribonuclease YbeY n=1 Tax=Peptoniphilus olsenii TaxID=411570 RepID=A0ABV2JBY8_9FIRM
MNIYFDNRQDVLEITDDIKDIINKAIICVLQIEDVDLNAEVSVSFVDDKEIKDLNKNYRNVDSSTDVLSFPIDDEFQINVNILGDVIINIMRVVKQARELGHSNERELAYLTVHSVLHLLGYDHMKDEDKKLMREKEKLAMSKLQIFR